MATVFLGSPACSEAFGVPCGGVAQLVRALPCHGRGYGFEPRRSRQLFRRRNPSFFLSRWSFESRHLLSQPRQARSKILEFCHVSVQSGVRTMRNTVKKDRTRTATVSKTSRRDEQSSQSQSLLTINSGSSSIKFALYRATASSVGRASPRDVSRRAASSMERLVSGKLERIGLPDSSLTIKDNDGHAQRHSVKASNHRAGGEFIITWLEKHFGFQSIIGIGHRVVHGGPKFTSPQRLTRDLVHELDRLSPYDPEHLPSSLELMGLFHQHHPHVPQVACFDTAFHSQMPRVAKILPIPRRFDKKGVQRFGFHGLSYSYLMEELQRIAGRKVANGRIILAHLGNGASMAAVRNGKSIDTTMGFTPAAGLPMSTRSGDLDPGLVWYFARTENITGQKFHDMVHHESGLLGVSETSPDMRDLQA